MSRIYYSFSTFICVPAARSQPGGYTLGSQAGEAAIREVTSQAGFSRFRRADTNPVQRRLRSPSLKKEH